MPNGSTVLEMLARYVRLLPGKPYAAVALAAVATSALFTMFYNRGHVLYAVGVAPIFSEACRLKSSISHPPKSTLREIETQSNGP